MALDEFNRSKGRKPLSVDLETLSAGEWLIFDTTELVAAFDIPVGMHLVIDLISFSSPAGDAGNLLIFAADVVRDATTDPVTGLVVDTLSHSALGVFFHIINAANTGVAMTSIDIYNTFAVNDISGNTDSVMIFWFHYEEGGMDFSQENREAVLDIRQLEATQGDPGDMFHMLEGVIDQLFTGGA